MFAIAILTALLLAVPSDCQQLIGSPPSQNQDVVIGNTLLVTCMPADNSAAVQNLKWYGPKDYFDITSGVSEPKLIRNREDMPRDPDTQDLSRVYIQSAGSNALSLNIEKVQATDGGVYQCRGKVSGVDSVFSITVRPYQAVVVRASANQYLIQGNEFGVILCTVDGVSPKTEWQKNGQVVVASGNGKYEILSFGLSVYNPEPSDAGRYNCRGISSQTGTVQEVLINVDVYVSPKISGRPKVLNSQGFGIARQSAVIGCNATGYPRPVFRWFLGTATDQGTQEVTDVRFGTRFRPDSAAGTLTILEIRVEDQAWYWCKAENLAGSSNAPVFFNVTMVAYFSWNQNSTDKNDGDTITLTCQSKAVPPANMQWLKWGRPQPYVDGVQVDDSRIRVYQKFAAPTEENQQILPKEVWIEIKNAKPQDMANYTCIATNIAGRNETTQEIRVNFKPVFVNMTSKVYNWEGNVRNLTCSTIAWPIPTWTWTYLGTVVTNDASHKIYYEYTNSSLEIRIPYVTLYGSLWGTYTCKASNNRGDAYGNVVLEEALFPEAPYNMSVKDITPTSMTLDVYLAPPLTIPVILMEVRAEKPGGSSAPVPYRFDLSQIHNMKIDSLYPSTAYTIRVTARNERGLGARDMSQLISTLPMSKPYPVTIVSGYVSSYPGSHLLIWDTLDNGGSAISQYTIKWRQVAGGSWTTQLVSPGLSFFIVPNLSPNTEYEAQVLATNSFGTSDPGALAYYFRTADGVVPTVVLQQGNGPLPQFIDLGVLQVYHVIIIAVVGLVAIFLSIDMVCCFTRHCGLFMCCYKCALDHNGERVPVQAETDTEDAQPTSGSLDEPKREVTKSSEMLYPFHGHGSAKLTGAGERDSTGAAPPATTGRNADGLQGSEHSVQQHGQQPFKQAASDFSNIYENHAYAGVVRKPAYQSTADTRTAGSPARPLPTLRGLWPQAQAGPRSVPTTIPTRSSQSSLEASQPNGSHVISARNSSAFREPSQDPLPPRPNPQPVSTVAGGGYSRDRHLQSELSPASSLRSQDTVSYHAAPSLSSRDSRLTPRSHIFTVDTGETDVDAYEDIEVSHYLNNRSAHARLKLPSTSTEV